MQTLDQLGAGFTLASHDLDIRGAGGLLGDEQSSHVRESASNSTSTCWKRRCVRRAAGEGSGAGLTRRSSACRC
jgi:transcription-repair coupling factor (superfamily II helicase)